MSPRSLFVVALLLAGAQAAAEPVKAVLRAQATVTGPQVTLGDVVQLESGAGGNAVLAAIAVAEAPRAGQVLRLHAADLERALRRAGSAAIVTWAGAGETRVAVAVRTVGGGELERLALTALGELPGAQGRTLRMAGTVAPVDVPARAVRLHVRPLDAAALMPRTPVWIDILVDDKVYRTVRVPVLVDEERQVLVARRDLDAGDAVGDDTFETAVRNVAGMRAAPVSRDAVAPDARLAHRVRAGEVLNAAELVGRGGVLPGDHVRVVARDAALRIELDATVIHGGLPGQQVDVRVAHSGQALSGRLDAGATVVLR